MRKFGTRVSLLLGSLLFALPWVAFAEPTTVTIEPAGSTTWTEIVESNLLQPRAVEAPVAVPFLPMPGPREIGEPVGRSAPEAGAPVPGPGPSPSPPVMDDFAALGDDNSSIPPDTMGAVGPNHLMVMLNTQVRVQDKTGGNISTVTLDAFWTSGTGLSGNPFDPRLIYDSIDGRWIASVDADARLATSAAWFAISDSDDPTGTWTFYGIDADPANLNWADFPGFGVNATWIAITNNIFRNSNDMFKGVKMWVIDKSTALAGGALTLTTFATGFDSSGGADGFAIQPAITYSPLEPTLYIMDNSGWSSGGTPLLRMSQITGTGPAPVWSVVPGSPFAASGFFFVANNFGFSQIDADQLGTATDVDTNDTRLSTFTINRNGHLWVTHSGANPGVADRTNVYWYELDPALMVSSGAPIVQSGVIDGGAGTHHFFPAIAVNQNDDVCIGMSRSDATRFVEAIVADRVSTDPSGTLSALTVIKAGEDSYVKDFGSGRVRWGDYSAAAVDPSDDLTLWTIQQYAETDVGPSASADRWGTWWARKSDVCLVNGDCDDGIFCNGAEICNAGVCELGAPPSCDDGVGCTLDSCNAISDLCENAPDATSCDDGVFCNGLEMCDAALDCQPGAGICSAACDEAANVCDFDVDADTVYDPNDNCTAVANQDQRDTNGDNIGNICDQDVSNDFAVGLPDFNAFLLGFNLAPGDPGYDPDLDFDGDGAGGNGPIGLPDFNLLLSSFNDAPGPSGPICPHHRCEQGGSLAPPCDSCVAQICLADPSCCSTSWDATCISQVGSVCGEACGCDHDLCTTGTPLDPSCDSCVGAICDADPSCCSASWDASCVSEVGTTCGRVCP